MRVKAGDPIETIQGDIDAAGERLQLCRGEIAVLILHGVEFMNDHVPTIPAVPFLVFDT
jgi:hypothetical protein